MLGSTSEGIRCLFKSAVRIGCTIETETDGIFSTESISVARARGFRTSIMHSILAISLLERMRSRSEDFLLSASTADCCLLLCQALKHCKCRLPARCNFLYQLVFWELEPFLCCLKSVLRNIAMLEVRYNSAETRQGLFHSLQLQAFVNGNRKGMGSARNLLPMKLVKSWNDVTCIVLCHGHELLFKLPFRKHALQISGNYFCFVTLSYFPGRKDVAAKLPFTDEMD